MIRFLIVFVLLLLPNVAHTFQTTDEGTTDYRLKVRFDIEASKIMGTATVPVKEGQELRVHKGSLRLTYVNLDKEKVDFSERR